MTKYKTSKNYKRLNHNYVIIINIENVKFPIPNLMLRSVGVYT